MTTTIDFRPITEAPVRKGIKFGPCVLDLVTHFRIGYWDGEDWHDRRGDPLAPVRFALLQPTDQRIPL